jgi:predicted MFS family arabinose efflux permease
MLPNAIALNSMGFNVARVLGPAIGGLLMAALGEGICFLLNAISYLAVLWGLWCIHVDATGTSHGPDAQHAGALQAGVRYVLERRELARILLLVGVVGAIAVSYRAFLPAMARTVLGVGAWRYGLLMAAAGVGAGAGGFLLAGQRLRADTYRRLLPFSLLGFSFALSAFALSRNYTASLFCLAAVGGGGILYFNASNTLVQLGVEDAFRGRVMSLYTLMHQGTATFGSLVLGVVAERYGTPLALISGAAICLTAVAVFVIESQIELRLREDMTPVAGAD